MYLVHPSLFLFSYRLSHNSVTNLTSIILHQPAKKQSCRYCALLGFEPKATTCKEQVIPLTIAGPSPNVVGLENVF